MDKLKEAVRDMAFKAFNEGTAIPGFTNHGYELHEVTTNSVIVRVRPGEQTQHAAPRYFEIKITEKL